MGLTEALHLESGKLEPWAKSNMAVFIHCKCGTQSCLFIYILHM